MTKTDLTQKVSIQGMDEEATPHHPSRYMHDKAFPSKESLAFPKAPQWDRKAYLDKKGRMRKPDNLEERLHTWLVKVGFRMLNEGRSTMETLADDLYEEAQERAPHGTFVTDEEQAQGRNSKVVSLEHLDAQTTRVAAFVAAEFDPLYTARLSAMGRKGGKKSKPPTKHTLTAFLELPEGMSVKEQAAAMGCDERTIYRLRAKKKSQDMEQAQAAEESKVDPIVSATMDKLEWDLYAYVDRLQEEKRQAATEELGSLLDSLDWT
jgi:hypothetical protein